MSTLSDDDLTFLLDEAASSYEVPEHGPDEILAAIAAEPARPAMLRRRWVQLSAAAAVVTAGVVFAAAQYGGSDGGSIMATAGKADSLDTYGKYAPTTGGTAGGGSAAAPGAASYTSMQAQSEKAARTGTRTFGTAGSASVGGSASGSQNLDAVRAPVPAALAPAAPAAAPVAGVSAQVGAPVDGGDSRVVKSGSIALVVKDKRVTPTITAVTQAAKSYGGYVAAGNTDEYGDTPSGEVTLRVPVAHFEDLVAKVRALDAKVRTASTSGKDVTAEYADLDAQLQTLKATRDRFLLILSKTRTISEILTVQQRVDSVQGQIDRIEGQRKVLASQSDLSTLTVSVSEEGDPVVKATTKPRSGLSQAFIDAKNGFVSGVEAIIRHSGGFLLLVLCLAVLLALGRVTWRVARRRMV
jgi:hypothetical protein